MLFFLSFPTRRSSDLSQDRSVSENNGNLGYRRAMLPDGLYDLETVIYGTSVGEVSEPVRSRLGYHIVKVNDKRESVGNLEIRHILIDRKSTRLNSSHVAISYAVFCLK